MTHNTRNRKSGGAHVEEQAKAEQILSSAFRLSAESMPFHPSGVEIIPMEPLFQRRRQQRPPAIRVLVRDEEAKKKMLEALHERPKISVVFAGFSNRAALELGTPEFANSVGDLKKLLNDFEGDFGEHKMVPIENCPRGPLETGDFAEFKEYLADMKIRENTHLKLEVFDGSQQYFYMLAAEKVIKEVEQVALVKLIERLPNDKVSTFKAFRQFINPN